MYTVEIKVTKHTPATVTKDRYDSVTANTPASESRIGHITLTGDDLEDLRRRTAAVMAEVTD